MAVSKKKVKKKAPGEILKGLEVILFGTEKQWIAWLKKNHKQPDGIWIKFAKKGSEYSSISYEQAREGAIRYGWIDGLLKSLSADFYLRKFTPRRPRSNWSKINVTIAEELIKEKRMEPSGLAEIDAAKADGRWELAYAPQSTIEISPDLQEKLDANPKAKDFFESLNKTEQYTFLYRIQTAKRKETREKHVLKTMEMLGNGEVYHRIKSTPVKKVAKKKVTKKKVIRQKKK